MSKLYKIRRAIKKNPNAFRDSYGIFIERNGRIYTSYYARKSYKKFKDHVLKEIDVALA